MLGWRITVILHYQSKCVLGEGTSTDVQLEMKQGPVKRRREVRTTHLVKLSLGSATAIAMDEVKIFEDPLNWKQNRMPCKADRIIFPDTITVIINSSVSAKEIVLPYNGAIIFGENAKIELYENAADDSCPGEDLLFTGEGSSHWGTGNASSSLSRLVLNLLVVAIICAVIYGVYLNQDRGIAVSEMVTVLTSSVRQVSGRLSRFYVQRPVEGTFNFVRFQGDDDNIEMELGAHSMTTTDASHTGIREIDEVEAGIGRVGGKATVLGKGARSLRGLGYLMSDIEEIEEEEVGDGETPDYANDRTSEPETAVESEKRLLLDEE